jgi:hypothetical protein
MTASVFIYYRVAAASAEDVRVAATALLEGVERLCGVGGRLMQRADDALTWMEVYPQVSDPALLQAAIAQALPESGLELLLAGSRHTEVFIEQAPPRCA